MDTTIKPGTRVTCQDDQRAEQYVKKNHTYIVEKVMHRGTLLELQGVAITLASCRFIKASSTPVSPMELANASNQ